MNISAGLGVAVREFPLKTRRCRLPALRRRQGHRRRRGQARRATRSPASKRSPASTSTACPTGLPHYRLPLPFAYESTGDVTQFTNALEPDARSREVFTFHRPEELIRLATLDQQVRALLREMPPLNTAASLAGADREHPEPRNVAGRQPAPLADPDGDRQRQDVHRRQLLLPPHQVRQGQAHPVPGGPQQPRQADAQRVPAVRQPVQRLQVHRGVHRPAPEAEHHRPGQQGLHHDHPAALLDAQGRGGLPRRERGRLAVRDGNLAHQGAAAGRLQPEDPHRDVRLHRRR